MRLRRSGRTDLCLLSIPQHSHLAAFYIVSVGPNIVAPSTLFGWENAVCSCSICCRCSSLQNVIDALVCKGIIWSSYTGRWRVGRWAVTFGTARKGLNGKLRHYDAIVFFVTIFVFWNIRYHNLIQDAVLVRLYDIRPSLTRNLISSH